MSIHPQIVDLDSKIAANLEELRKLSDLDLPQAVIAPLQRRYSKIDRALVDARNYLTKALSDYHGSS